MNNARMLWLKSVCVAVIAMALVGWGAPGGSQAVAASDGSTPEPDLVYQADWSSGIGGWAGGAGWKTLNGALLNDGTAGYNSGFGSTIFADFEPGSMADLAVEAEIRLIRLGGSSFGVVVRAGENGGGYAGGVGSEGDRPEVYYFGGDRIAVGEGFAPGGDWHTYRVEAKDNVITFLVDGAVLVEVEDNIYLEGGRVGLWCSGFQLEVRGFKVFAI